MKKRIVVTNITINNLPDYPLRRYTVCRICDNAIWFYGTYDKEDIADTVTKHLDNAFVIETQTKGEKE